MIDPTTMVPSLQDIRSEVFDELSRYRGLPLLHYTTKDGEEIVYVERRFVPPPESMAAVGQFEVQEGDRIDNIAADQFGDPRWWWRIADANRALRPAELTERIGRRLLLTLPVGVPGPRGG